MSREIPKAYHPQEWEDTLYARWEASGYFNPDTLIEKGIVAPDAPTFSMVLPPPNVTGHLHVGHASMLALEDIMTRFHRMRGYRTLWLPGTDHAAVATQSKVENILYKEEGKTRHDFTREDFLARVEDFAQKSHDTIINQTKKMGASLDWSREAYTLDEPRTQAVRTAFKRMYDDGIVYRGYRTINWSVQGQSTCSDDEVVHVDRPGKLYTFYYNETFRDLGLAVATTRPETKLGDIAVAVHPGDSRYTQHIGTHLNVESFASGPSLSIDIIADEMVDPDFGTGVVGITPLHSHTDYDFFLRHEGEFSSQPEALIDMQGRMTATAGPAYTGLTTLEAREKVLENLRARGLFIKEEDVTQSVGTSDRFGDVIETIPLEQWFIGVNREFERHGTKTTLKQLMQEAITSEAITIIPEHFRSTYFYWVNNLRDWCISRQIWYGHRIPVWYRGDEIFCGVIPPEGSDWIQDPDTLDTWFSSGLWTFSTLGWGSDEARWERERIYHPTTVLETGYDILFFWVARMILMSTYLLGEVPFRNVYLHGLVRDDQGRKMSKSLGNVLDPLDIIPTYGADALRLSLVLGNTPGNDIKIGTEKIANARNFTNKLWNIGRYVLTQSETTEHEAWSTQQAKIQNSKSLSSADQWILNQLSITVDEVTRHLEQYNFSLAGELLRDFTWNEFADWYVEIHKIEKNDAVLQYVFETLLRLWHPFMPFVTEALFQEMHPDTSALLMVEKWPTKDTSTTPQKDSVSFNTIIELITRIRNLRALYHIEPARKLTLTIVTENKNPLTIQQDIICRLARIETLTLHDRTIPFDTHGTATIALGDLQVYLHLAGIIDIRTERDRLTKEQQNLETYAARTRERLNNPTFATRAPESIVEQTRQELLTTEHTIERLREALGQLAL